MKHKLLLALLSIALISPSVWAAKGGNKPPPEPQPGQAAFVDASGVLIGDVQTSVRAGKATVLFQVGDKIYQAPIQERSGLADFVGDVYYDGLDCTGNVYVRLPLQVIVGVEVLHHLGKDGIFYTTESDTPKQLTPPFYYWLQEGGYAECFLETGNPDVYDAVPVVDTSVYARPFRLKLFPTQ